VITRFIARSAFVSVEKLVTNKLEEQLIWNFVTRSDAGIAEHLLRSRVHLIRHFLEARTILSNSQCFVGYSYGEYRIG